VIAWRILRAAPVTATLLAAIGAMFLVEMASGGSTRIDVLVALGANVGVKVAEGEVWRLLASMFLHIGLLHLAVNGWALYQLGALMEIWIGSARFVGLYFVSGIAGSLTSFLWSYEIQGRGEVVSAGASGAIFGILGALIGFLLRRRGRLTSQARSLLAQLLFWAGLNLFLGFTIAFIDNAGHLGGLATGFVLGLGLKARPRE
jgi:rhomboid protease GluP